MSSRLNRFIPLYEPLLTSRDKELVNEALDSGWISSTGTGKYVDAFERNFAQQLGLSIPGVSTVNGTSAIHLALRVLGIEKGDLVLTQDLTFIAPINAILYTGAMPVLFGPARELPITSADHIEQFLHLECETRQNGTFHKSSGRRVSALLFVHLFGFMEDPNRLKSIARKWQLHFIEDATEALGSSFVKDHDPVPAGKTGLFGCFSFNGNKLLTTAGGGMLVSNDPDLLWKAKHLSTQARSHPIEYEHDDIGYNYRLSNLQAALGLGQLERIAEITRKKKNIAAVYKEKVRQHLQSSATFVQSELCDNCHWLNIIRLEHPLNKEQRLRLITRAKDHGFSIRPLFTPAHLLAPYQTFLRSGTADSLYWHQHALCLPSTPDLTEEEQDYVIKSLSEFL